MQNSSDPTVATNVNPESFKAQLKKLSGKSHALKASSTGNAFDGLVEPNKTALAKPRVSKAKRLSGQDDPDNQSDSVQSDAANSTPSDAPIHNATPSVKEELAANGASTNPVSNSVSIAGLSTYERQGTANPSNASFESQSEIPSDTVLAQITPASVVTGSIATSASSFSLPGLGAGLGALALAGGAKGGASGGASQTVTTPTTPTDISTTLTGFIAAGPVINNGGLKVEAFDARGNLLVSTTSIQSDGTFSVSLKNGHTGVVKLVVSDTNGSDVNFLDEATGQGKSIGVDPLVTIFNLPAGQTTFSLNINPLTTEAANNVLATVGNDLTKATSASISSANLDIASKYGISDTSNPDGLVTTKPALLIDSKGAINQEFDEYGLALAVKSVLDDNPSLSMKDAVKSLANNPLYASWTNGQLTWASLISGFGDSFLKNHMPTGSLTITDSNGQELSQTTTQGQVLTVASTIADVDGIPATGSGALSFKWQSSPDGNVNTWTDIIDRATATTFTTTQAQVGKQVRAVATYIDNLGTTETVTSNPTNKVLSSFGTTSVPLSPQALGAVETFAAGDLNGDGIADWLFIFKGGNVNTGGLLGKAYVVYGNTTGKFDLSDPASGATSSTQVFSLEKGVGGDIGMPELSTQVGILPIVVNDFNGNGVGEVAFASQRQVAMLPGLNAAPPGNYIDFYDASGGNSLPRITNSFVDMNRSTSFGFGYKSVTSGDINGDGLADIFVGDDQRKKVFVLFGDTNLVGKINNDKNGTVLTPDIQSSNKAFKGIYITDSNPNTVVSADLSFGWAISYLGDTNGDGYGDLAIANSYAGTPSLKSPEEIFVIYGGAQINNTDLDVNQIRIGNGSSIGYVIKADLDLPFLACDAGLNATKIYGDFNGDGRNDFIFEGQSYDHTAAKFYVVFGRQNDNTPINLNALGNKGFTISLPSIALKNVIFQDMDAIPNKDVPRETATNCGDLNGDGIDDILIKLTFNTTIPTDSAHKLNHFLAYVVYGKTNTDNVDLNNLDDKGTSAYGYKIVDLSKTIDVSSNFLGNITAPGDINGDAIPDLILDDYTGANNLLPTVKLGSTTNALLGSQTKFTAQGTGTSGNDTINLNTINIDETLVGGAGDDVIHGNGGADVMYGGAGNDSFNLTQNNIDQLTRGVSSSGRLARVDGGGGIDTLALSGTGVSLDLTQIANSRLQSIEKINLGVGNNLKVAWSDIQNMSAMNLFNKATGWTGLGDGTVSYHQMVIDGQQSKVDFTNDGGGWVKTTSASNFITNTSETYDLYTNASQATQLLINTKIGTVIF